jgi:Ribbon-helix-helix protein, copG family
MCLGAVGRAVMPLGPVREPARRADGRTAMAKSDTDAAVDTERTDQAERTPASPPRRINVAVTPDMLAAIDRIIEREQVTLTEAVRRLIAYGDVVYRMVKEEGQTMVFRSENGNEREVMLI